MANFNETIKATKSGRISVASYCDIVICKWMFEREEERKTRESEMIVGGMVGGWARTAKRRMRNEIAAHRIAI